MRLAEVCRQIVAVAAPALGCPDAPMVPPDPRAASGGGEIGFEALAPGDQVAVHFESHGCFHHDAADVLVTRLDDGLGVRVLRSSGMMRSGWRVVPHLTLGRGEMRALDRQLTFYRSNAGDGCTTVDRVTLRVLSGRLRGRFEFYRDASCGSYDREDLYPVGGLVRMTRDSSARDAS